MRFNKISIRTGPTSAYIALYVVAVLLQGGVI